MACPRSAEWEQFPVLVSASLIGQSRHDEEKFGKIVVSAAWSMPKIYAAVGAAIMRTKRECMEENLEKENDGGSPEQESSVGTNRALLAQQKASLIGNQRSSSTMLFDLASLKPGRETSVTGEKRNVNLTRSMSGSHMESNDPRSGQPAGAAPVAKGPRSSQLQSAPSWSSGVALAPREDGVAESCRSPPVVARKAVPPPRPPRAGPGPESQKGEPRVVMMGSRSPCPIVRNQTGVGFHEKSILARWIPVDKSQAVGHLRTTLLGALFTEEESRSEQEAEAVNTRKMYFSQFARMYFMTREGVQELAEDTEFQFLRGGRVLLDDGTITQDLPRISHSAEDSFSLDSGSFRMSTSGSGLRLRPPVGSGPGPRRRSVSPSSEERRGRGGRGLYGRPCMLFGEAPPPPSAIFFDEDASLLLPPLVIPDGFPAEAPPIPQGKRAVLFREPKIELKAEAVGASPVRKVVRTQTLSAAVSPYTVDGEDEGTAGRRQERKPAPVGSLKARQEVSPRVSRTTVRPVSDMQDVQLLKVMVDDIGLECSSLRIPYDDKTTVHGVIGMIEKKLRLSPRKNFGIYVKGAFCEDVGVFISSYVTADVDSVTYALVPNSTLFDFFMRGSKFAQRLVEAAPVSVVFSTDDLGDTLLHKAVRAFGSRKFSYTSTVKALLKRRPIPSDFLNHANRDNITALALAAQLKCFPMITYLLHQSGIDTNAGGQTALHFLCDSPLTEVEEIIRFKSFIEKLLDKGASPVAQCSRTGNTPLHYACERGLMEFVKFFLARFRIDVNLRNFSCETLLHSASRGGHLVLTKFLIDEYGGLRDIANAKGEIPFDLCPQHLLLDSLKVLYDTYGLPREIFDAIRENDMEEVQRLCNAKAVKGFLSSSTATVPTGSTSTRQLTLSDIMSSSLYWSCVRGHLGIASWLCDQPGVLIDWKTPSGSSPIIALLRTFWGDKEYGPLLLKMVQMGASLKTRLQSGDTALHVATLSENSFGIHFLVDQGHFLNNFNLNGESELHFAVMTNNSRLVSDLLRAGCDPEIQSSSGSTCIDLARDLRAQKIERLILRHIGRESDLKELEDAPIQPNVLEVHVRKVKPVGEKLSTSSLDMIERMRTKHVCVLRHLFEEKVRVAQVWVDQTTNKEERQRLLFVIRKDHLYFKDLMVEVWSKDPTDSIVTCIQGYLGKSTMILDPRSRRQEVTMDMYNRQGEHTASVDLEMSFAQYSTTELKCVLDTYEVYDPLHEAKLLKKETHKKRIGEAMASIGYKPKYPVIIIPGIASSALEAWETSDLSWHRERVWIDPFKVGKTAGLQKLSQLKDKVLHTENESSSKIEKQGFLTSIKNTKQEMVDADQARKAQISRKWLKYMMLDSDGVSDPPGVKIRPVQGLHGCDYLSDNPLCKAPSYVFGHVIRTLTEVGYDLHNLDAAPYDWRLPPEKLFERDNYFLKLKFSIHAMRIRNNEKVVLMAHSMGNRCVQYFLHWLKLDDPKFIDENIHAFLAMGPPFLGAPKGMRCLMVGDAMGLEMFLTLTEARTMSRNSASLPWLFSVREELFPDVVARIRTGDAYQSYNTDTLTKQYATKSYRFFHQYFLNDPNYLKRVNATDPPAVFQAPPVRNVWVIMGVNIPTEVSYYFKESKEKKRLVLDTSADKYSQQKLAFTNPRGLRVTDGVAYETRETYQPSIRGNKCGDGTVPFCSLNFAATWREQAKSQGKDLDVTTIEIEGAEHREMLNHDAVHMHIIQFVCCLEKSE